MGSKVNDELVATVRAAIRRRSGEFFAERFMKLDLELLDVVMSLEKEELSLHKRKLSCTSCFDALWFCYSPVHQMQHYYRLGSLDNCSGKWTALVDCLTFKTKRSSELQEILEMPEKKKAHIWTFRTPSEASAHWEDLRRFK